MAYITEVLNAAPAVANVRAYCATVRNLAKVRAAILTAQRIVAQGYAGFGDPTEFVTGAAESMHAVAFDPTMSRIRPIREPLRERMQQIADANKSGARILGTPTGFDVLDRMTGGWKGGQLITVAGLTGMGKSALANCCALNVAARGDAVAMFCLEMLDVEMVDRSLGVEAGVDTRRIGTGNLTPAEWSRLTPACQRVDGLPLWVDDSAGITSLEISAKVRHVQSQEAKNKRKLGLIVIDYLQLMRPMQAHPSREREVSAMAWECKELAKRTKVPVILLSQLNRAANASEKPAPPKLQHLRESGAIEQHR